MRNRQDMILQNTNWSGRACPLLLHISLGTGPITAGYQVRAAHTALRAMAEGETGKQMGKGTTEAPTKPGGSTETLWNSDVLER